MPWASSKDSMELALLKQFKLLPFNTFFLWHLPIENFNITKLLVCNTHYTDISILGKKRLDSFDMNCRVIITGAMPSIYRQLEHHKTITLQVLSECGITFLILLRYCWQIKEH